MAIDQCRERRLEGIRRERHVAVSEKLTTFITQWLRMNVVGRVGSSEDVTHLVAKCVSDAARQNISRRDLEDQVGPLDECIRMALRDTKR